MREFVLATCPCSSSLKNGIGGHPRTANGALAAEWRLSALCRCGILAPGALSRVRGRSGARMVHGAERADALVREWCKVQRARTLQCEHGAEWTDAPVREWCCTGVRGRCGARVVHSAVCTEVRGRSGAKVVHGPERADALVRDPWGPLLLNFKRYLLIF